MQSVVRGLGRTKQLSLVYTRAQTLSSYHIRCSLCLFIMLLLLLLLLMLLLSSSLSIHTRVQFMQCNMHGHLHLFVGNFFISIATDLLYTLTWIVSLILLAFIRLLLILPAHCFVTMLLLLFLYCSFFTSKGFFSSKHFFSSGFAPYELPSLHICSCNCICICKCINSVCLCCYYIYVVVVVALAFILHNDEYLMRFSVQNHYHNQIDLCFLHSPLFICGKFNTVLKKHPALSIFLCLKCCIALCCALHLCHCRCAVCVQNCALTLCLHACIRWLKPTRVAELTLVSIKEIEEQNNCNQKYIRCSNKTSSDFMYVCGFATTFLRACVSQYKRL